MLYIKAVSPKLVIHYLKYNPDDKTDMDCLDNLIDRGFEIRKSENTKEHIPIQRLYEKLI